MEQVNAERRPLGVERAALRIDLLHERLNARGCRSMDGGIAVESLPDLSGRARCVEHALGPCKAGRHRRQDGHREDERAPRISAWS